MKLGPFAVMRRRQRATTYTGDEIGAAGVGDPQPFSWFRGLTTLTLIDNSTNYSWQIQLQGGQAEQSAEPGMFVSYINGTGVDCLNNALTVTMPPQPTPLDQITVVTPVTGMGGASRTYIITFSPYITVLPTIEMSAGAAFTTTATLTSIAYTVKSVFGVR